MLLLMYQLAGTCSCLFRPYGLLFLVLWVFHRSENVELRSRKILFSYCYYYYYYYYYVMLCTFIIVYSAFLS
jgi:hypothetical protein